MILRKKPRILIVALALMLILPSAASAAANLGVIRMTSSSGSLNVRTGPSTRYKVRGWALHGDRVIILSAGKAWHHVRVVRTGVTGYVAKPYVTRMVNVASLKNWGAMARIKTKYASSTVCLRTGPGTRYTVLRYLSPSDALAVLGKAGSWYEVQLVPSLTTGYVYKDYITNGAHGITNASVNLRKSGSARSKILRCAQKGEPITIMKIGANWSKVAYKGKTGYMHNKYIGVTNIAPS
jgi:uncharacterized protein YgiM (DUF1202 family)